MVLLVVKKSEETLFLYQTTTQIPIQDLIDQLVSLQNMRLRIKRLVSAAEDLVEYGFYKPESEHGYSEEHLEELAKEQQPKPKEKVVKNGVEILLNPDPTGRRTGEAPSEDMADVINKTLAHAQTCLSADMVTANKSITMDILKEAFDNIRGAVTIVYPQGLPEWEPVREIFDDCENLEGSAASKEIFDPQDTNLWWANKQLVANKILADYIGKNEKTKVIIKMHKKAYGAPVREAPLNEQAQKEMMAYYYKKQEEHKKLLENDDDDYLHSTWANTGALKAQFQGLSNMKWGPR